MVMATLDKSGEYVIAFFNFLGSYSLWADYKLKEQIQVHISIKKENINYWNEA